MKKYTAPELLALSYASLEAISASADEDSSEYNDGELDW